MVRLWKRSSQIASLSASSIAPNYAEGIIAVPVSGSPETHLYRVAALRKSGRVSHR